MECPICLNVISNSCYANCSHHFCYECLKNWCYMGGKKCPMCKERMFQIILDKEFDLKNNPLCDKEIEKELTKTIYVNLKGIIEPGIRVKERGAVVNEKKKEYGVIVTELEKNKKLIEYLKENDIIMYLNGMPCVKSYDTLEIIKKYFNTGDILKIELLNKSNKRESYCYGGRGCMGVLWGLYGCFS